MAPRFPEQALVEYAATALHAVGVPLEDADVTSKSLVEADRRGIYSHGLVRLPLYVEALQAGGIKAQPNLRLTERGATALLDGDSGLGQVTMAAAVARASALAKQHGVAAVAVQGSVHYGAGAYWTDMLVRQGLAAILVSTTGPTVTPFGGAQKILGTNPLTISMPSADDHPLTADMATSAGAYGKVVVAQNEGREIPAGWAVDSNGDPTQDAAAALQGALLPFGGPKGSALAVMIEALAAAFTTAAFSFETEDIWVNRASQMNTGHLLIALDTDAFGGREHTERRVATLQRRVRSTGAGGRTVHAPGDLEYARGSDDGSVPLAASTVQQLNELAAKLSIPPIPGA